MDGMKLSIKLWGILFHSSRSEISTFQTVIETHCRTTGRLSVMVIVITVVRCPFVSQIWSNGFKSGEYASYFIFCIVSISGMFFTSPDAWDLVLSYLKKGIANGCIVMYDMGYWYFAFISFDYQSAIQENMQVHTFTYANSVQPHWSFLY